MNKTLNTTATAFTLAAAITSVPLDAEAARRIHRNDDNTATEKAEDFRARLGGSIGLDFGDFDLGIGYRGNMLGQSTESALTFDAVAELHKRFSLGIGGRVEGHDRQNDASLGPILELRFGKKELRLGKKEQNVFGGEILLRVDERKRDEGVVGFAEAEYQRNFRNGMHLGAAYNTEDGHSGLVRCIEGRVGAEVLDGWVDFHVAGGGCAVGRGSEINAGILGLNLDLIVPVGQ